MSPPAVDLTRGLHFTNDTTSVLSTGNGLRCCERLALRRRMHVNLVYEKTKNQKKKTPFTLFIYLFSTLLVTVCLIRGSGTL